MIDCDDFWRMFGLPASPEPVWCAIGTLGAVLVAVPTILLGLIVREWIAGE